jgi:hypothetical protein
MRALAALVLSAGLAVTLATATGGRRSGPSRAGWTGYAARGLPPRADCASAAARPKPRLREGSSQAVCTMVFTAAVPQP